MTCQTSQQGVLMFEIVLTRSYMGLKIDMIIWATKPDQYTFQTSRCHVYICSIYDPLGLVTKTKVWTQRQILQPWGDPTVPCSPCWCETRQSSVHQLRWVGVNTYRYIFSGMNIHLPAILGFTRYQGFDPYPDVEDPPWLSMIFRTGNPVFWFPVGNQQLFCMVKHLPPTTSIAKISNDVLHSYDRHTKVLDPHQCMKTGIYGCSSQKKRVL
jgi:hypothetical protein